ncbi:hypothetical protein F5X97DRAFT_312464 [Nemania serpens]|nr:hypothetical protein F5X97DRAFT_312464 [Nemania serpens]
MICHRYPFLPFIVQPRCLIPAIIFAPLPAAFLAALHDNLESMTYLHHYLPKYTTYNTDAAGIRIASSPRKLPPLGIAPSTTLNLSRVIATNVYYAHSNCNVCCY